MTLHSFSFSWNAETTSLIKHPFPIDAERVVTNVPFEHPNAIKVDEWTNAGCQLGPLTSWSFGLVIRSALLRHRIDAPTSEIRT